MRRNLIVFLRYPEPGKAKTRLVPELGEERAANIAHELAERTIELAVRLASQTDIDISVWYAGCNESEARHIAPGAAAYHEQSGDDLGARMSAAFESAFSDGYREVALVGTDCPELDESIISEAFDVLADVDVSVGPTTDGGYYLIALKAPAPGLFEEMPWGSSSVLESTARAAEDLGLSAVALPVLWDVDRPEDLVHYELFKTRADLLP